MFFLESIIPLLKQDSSLHVLCAGSSNFADEEVRSFKKFNVEDRVLHRRFKDDEELSYLYNNALCFVFPSLYEGFGIPVLESFVCECPTVVSNTSSLPEVGGNACEYFTPDNSESIKNAVKNVIYDESKRKKMILKGKERAKLFSWERTAKAYEKIYMSLVKE